MIRYWDCAGFGDVEEKETEGGDKTSDLTTISEPPITLKMKELILNHWLIMQATYFFDTYPLNPLVDLCLHYLMIDNELVIFHPSKYKPLILF